MSNIKKNVLELIGHTPLVELTNFEKNNDIKAKIIAKLEYLNPAGSVKDRVAKAIIGDAMAKGLINKDTIIIEPTSGNTGIGLAAVCSAYKLKLVIVMPSSMSEERRNLIKAYGAKLELTDGALGMQGAIDRANEIAKENKNSIIAGQFTNPINPKIHELTTGPEIYKDTDGKVDIFVAGIGTGGTLSGVGRYLKKMNPNIKIVGIEPAGSPVLTKGVAGPHKLQGIGAGFIPDTLDTNVYDEVLTIEDDDAFNAAREVAKSDGILVGISAGSALKGAMILAKREENKGKNIVVLFPDTGDRYLSTELFKN